MHKFVLITGGARSGKSSYALERCEAVSNSRCFVATSPSLDQEMQNRIQAHQLEREGRGWQTCEEQTELPHILTSLTHYDVVLVDCLTLWVNNIMFAAEQRAEEFGEDEIWQATTELIRAVRAFPGSLYCVTNEVGMGIVPENPLARKYRDLVGRCNRLLASVADEVVLVSCGIPLHLKQENMT